MKQDRKYRRVDMSVQMTHYKWRRHRTSTEPEEVLPTFSERLNEQYGRLKENVTVLWGKRTKGQVFALSISLGLFIGLVVLGWWLVPVQWDASNWTGANFNNLPQAKRQMVIENSAELFSYTTDQERVRQLLRDWPGAVEDICYLAEQEDDQSGKLRLEALVYIETGKMCNVEQAAE